MRTKCVGTGFCAAAAAVALLYLCAHFLKILNETTTTTKPSPKFCIINPQSMCVCAAWQFKMFAY